jgi:excisionase family DNA binding protein
MEYPMALHETITMPDSEEAQVEELRRILQLGSPELVGLNGTERISLPASIYKALKDVVRNMQLGRAIMIVPEQEDLTTQRVANILGVSRPHVIKLLGAGEMPFHKAGSHRRVYLKDVMQYAKRRDAERRRILASLAKKAYDEGLYDNAGIPDGGEDE